jgi:hypothetical protein
MSLARCTCGREWNGLAQAHCPTCHAHFSTVGNFDRHRPGSAGCQDPATLTRSNGERLFKPVLSALGTTWAENSDRPDQADVDA